jgi:hypothetical protein
LTSKSNVINQHYNGQKRKDVACYQQGVVQGMWNMCRVLPKGRFGFG